MPLPPPTEATAVVGTMPDTEPAASAAPTMGPGDRVGRYEILGRLGEGGMGTVFRARDPELDREVAVKILRGRSDPDGSGHERLVREAQAMARLSHPNVLPVYDVGTHGALVFVAMEVVEGLTLRQWLDAEPRSRDAVLDVFEAAGRGLAAAHAAQLVHRDFKPTNVLVGSDGRVRVMDFGLARATGSASEAPASGVRSDVSEGDALATPLTRAGFVMGTPAYMAPEQRTGAATDGRCDQFAFCVALHEALYGKRPFSSEAARHNDPELVAPPPDSNVPAKLRRIVVRGLAWDPAQRFATMDALLAALRRARRRRAPRIVAAVALGAAAASAAWWLGPSPADDCDVAQSLVRAWEDSDRDHIAATFEGHPGPLARATWPRLQPKLDAWVQSWTRARTETCEAARAEDADPTAIELQVACLRRARDSFDSLAQVLAEADATVIERAPWATARLPDAADCRDESRLRAAVAPPADPSTAEAVADVRARLAPVRALRESGRHPDAVARVRPLPAEAEATGYGPLIAEVNLLAGSLAHADGQYEWAADRLEAAYHAAVRSGDNEQAILAAAQLAMTLGVAMARHDDGETWARHARSRLSSADPSAAHESHVLSSEGMIAHARGDYETAVAKLTEALRQRRAALGPEDPRLLNPLNELAIAVTALGRYDEARTHFEAKLTIAEAVFGADHPETADALGNLAVVLDELGDKRGAIAKAERAKEIYLVTYGPDHPSLAQVHNALGTAKQARGHDEDALAEFEAALRVNELHLEPDHPRLAESLNNVAYVMKKLGRRQEALPLMRRALRVAEAGHGPDHPRLAIPLNNLGNLLQDLDQLDEAEQVLTRALSLREKGLGPDHDLVAASLKDLGELALAQGRPAIAVDHFERALGIVERSLGPDHPHTATVLTGLGDARLRIGEVESARAALRRALEIRTSHPDHPRSMIGETRFALAQALWQPPRDRDAALSLARAARDDYAADDFPEQKRSIDDWIRATMTDD